MSKRKILIISAVLVSITVLESTVFKKVLSGFVIPDIGLIMIIFYANSRGNMEGQIAGFVAGLAEDFISLSPLGFNCLIKTIIGFISGSTKSKIYIDPILFPVFLVLFFTLLKGLIAAVVCSVFLKPEIAPVVFSSKFLFEIVLNTFIAPFVFAFMKLVKLYRIEDRGI